LIAALLDLQIGQQYRIGVIPLRAEVLIPMCRLVH